MKINVTVDGFAEFVCPSCFGLIHELNISPYRPGPLWTWNRDVECPTFNEGLIIKNPYQCHVFIEDGKLRYCTDILGSFAGRTVDIPEFDRANQGQTA